MTPSDKTLLKKIIERMSDLSSIRTSCPTPREVSDDVEAIGVAVVDLCAVLLRNDAEPKRIDSITVSGNGTGITL